MLCFEYEDEDRGIVVRGVGDVEIETPSGNLRIYGNDVYFPFPDAEVELLSRNAITTDLDLRWTIRGNELNFSSPEKYENMISVEDPSLGKLRVANWIFLKDPSREKGEVIVAEVDRKHLLRKGNLTGNARILPQNSSQVNKIFKHRILVSDWETFKEAFMEQD